MHTQHTQHTRAQDAVELGKFLSFAIANRLAPTERRWMKVGADGTHYPIDDPRTDHVAAIDIDTGLMYAVASITGDNGSAMTQPQCIDRCAALRLLGFDDWRLATRNEAAWIISDTHRAPAVDPTIFTGIRSDRHWTSTPMINADRTASDSVSWHVLFYDGFFCCIDNDSDGFALAVRRAGF